MLARDDSFQAGEEAGALRTALAGMLLMAVVMGVGRFVYTPILPHMISEGALGASDAGLVAGFNYLGYLLGALAATAHFFAPRLYRWCLGGLAFSVATTALMAMADGIAAMSALRFASGAASAFAMIFATTIVLQRVTAAGRAGLMAWHFSGVAVGIATSAVLVSSLVDWYPGWRHLWLGAGLLGAVAAGAVALMLPRPAPQAVQARAATGKGPASRLPVTMFITAYGFFGFGYVVTATFINTLAKTEAALAPAEPWVWLVVGAAGFPSIWIWNAIAARLGLPATFAAACLVEAVGVALSVTVLTPAGVLVAAALLGFTFMAITALGVSAVAEMAPGRVGSVFAGITAAFGLGQMIGPVVAGWLFEVAGNFVAASLLAAAALAVSAVLAPAGIVLSARERRDH